MFGAAGLLYCLAGAAACHWHQPRILGLYAVGCAVQFLASVLLMQSMPMIVHCVLQPPLIMATLRLRRALVPLWFNTGRPTFQRR